MMRLSYDPVCRFSRLVFTAVLCFSWSGAVGQPQPPADASAEPVPVAKAAEVMGRILELARQELQKPGADPSDVPAQSALLGHDVAKLFAFVRDQVTYEPYSGVLRGARGALASRSANAIDKSLLLKGLLESSGYSCRIVTATLDEASAQKLVRQFLSGNPLAGPLGEYLIQSDSPEALREFSQKTGLDEGKIAQFAADAQKQAALFQQQADARSDDAAAYLQQQAQRNNLKLGQDVQTWEKQLVARARHHAWVQVQLKDGQWTDLDASFADAQEGKVYAKVDEQPRDLSKERHTVTFNLKYQTAEASDPQEILAVVVDDCDAMFEPVAFSIRPADAMPAPSKLLEMKQADRIKLLANIKKFQAVIQAGPKQFASRVFDLEGNLYDVSADGRVQGATEMGSAVGGLFGGGLGGGGDDAAKGPGFVSLTMEVSAQGPQSPATLQRRTLLNADQIKGDHQISPLLNWEVLIQPQVISASLAAYGTTLHTVDAMGPVLEAMKNQSAGTGFLDRLVSHSPQPYPTLLVQMAVMRQAALARAMKDKPAGALLWDRPQITVAERRFCMSIPIGHTCDQSRIDILDNSLTLVPRNDGEQSAVVERTMRQGVFDTVVEMMLLRTVSPEGKTISSIDGLDAARINGGQLEAYTGNNAGSSPLSEADRKLVADCEPSRQLMMLPGKEAGVWWSIDPLTGSVVGRSSGGHGGALVENQMLQQLAGGVMCFIAAAKDAASAGNNPGAQTLNLMKFLACTISMGTGVLGVVGGWGPKALGIVFYINLGITGGILLM
jgi:transglutaminase-like putative cysteine protease